MATIQVDNAPASRVEVGNTVLEAAAASDTAPVKARLAAFEKAHRAYLAAQAQVTKADEAVRKCQAAVAESDVTQDEAVNALAGALAGDGLNRTNPFKAFGFDAPSKLVNYGYAREAKEARRLTATVRKKAGSSVATLRALQKLEKAADAVVKALEPLTKLEDARRAAISRRDAVGLTWETTFAALKRGARAAADDGATMLFTALFDRPRAPKKPAVSTPPKA